MKYCPNCAEQNYDDATVCYACGKPLPYSPPPAEDEFPTQPLHVNPQHTQARPAQAQPSFPSQQVPYDPNVPPQGQGTYPNNPQQGYTEPGYQPQPGYPPPGYQQPGYPPPGYQQPGYPPPGYQQPGYQQPGYQPPTPQSALRRNLPLLVAGMLVMLLCACGASVWLLTDAAARGASAFGASFSTQVAGVLPGGSEENTPEPGVILPDPLEEPTPWPTFTLEPQLPTLPPEQPTLAPQPQPEATESPLTEKLLSPECKTALDELGRMGGEVSGEPFKLLDAAWRTQFEGAQAAVKLHCGSIDAASPVPARLEAVQQNLALANTAFDEANRLWTEAIDSRDPLKVIEAAGQFQQATGHLNEAIKALREVVQ